MSERQVQQQIQGTVLGVAVRTYKAEQFRELPNAVQQLNELCTLLEGYGYTPSVVKDPGRDSLKGSVEKWRKGWEESGSHGPAIVVWSGHGVLHGQDKDFRLIVHDTQSVDDEEQTYSARLLTNAALRSGADQVLMLIDTCYAGAGVVESLQKALSTWSTRSLPAGRSTWLGVVASCRPQEEAEGRGILLETVTDVLRNGPRTKSYRHEWSPRNWRVTGAAVIRAALDQWPEDEGQRPVPASLGQDLPMFGNPHKAEKGEAELVEHLVRAAAGADRVEEGWFFTGRRRVLGEIVDWVKAKEAGLFLVTGSAGSGKSAVLGRVATLSDPRHRADIVKHGALREGDPDPGENSVDVPLHLRGLTVQQLAEAIARRLGLDAPETPAALIADVEREWPPSGRPPVLLLDGLDEAASEQAAPIVEQLLSPLSRMACVLLASRDRPFNPDAEAAGEPLDEAVSRLLGIRARAAGLDDEVDTGDDIEEYARRRLHRTGLPDEAAALIAQRASVGHGGFLFAQMAVDAVLRHVPETGAEGWETNVPASISAAFTEHLAAGPQLEQNGELLPLAAHELLTALAWGTGNGMPARGVWETAATALSKSGTVYTREHLDWLLNSYGRYVIEDSDGVQAVYRLYHREFIEHLRELSGRHREEGQSWCAYLVARGLVGLLRQQSDDAAVLEHANPYLRESLAEHAVMAGGRGIALVRELVELREEVFRPDLARALAELARLLSEAGLREAALTPSQESAALYRTLADTNPAAYLPDLAASLNNLAVYQSETGDRTGALTTINEAVTIRRTLADTNPAAYLPNLAGSLNNLAASQSASGDRTGALTTINEATHLYRTLADTNPAAYLPDLAMSLNNLATSQGETGDRTGALTTINEAVTISRTLADTNPAAYLPDLAMSLNNLATSQGETGDRTGALTTINEAVTISRTLADTNPAAYLPDLAMSLNNLATYQSETGDRTGALTTINEAVTISRTLADTNPAAHLPNLATSLNNLARIAPPQQALIAYAKAEESLSAHSAAARQITAQRAEFQLSQPDQDAGIRTLIDLLLSLPDGPDPVALKARRLLRNCHRTSATGTAQVRTAWRTAAGTDAPAWLDLPETAFDLAIAWIQCPTWADSRAFWDEHAADFQSPETILALEELALAYRSAEQHLHITRAAMADTSDFAFRPYITGELLSTWIDCPTWEESQTYLSGHAKDLLHDQAATLLASDNESAEATIHLALLRLARVDGIPNAYGYIANRTALNERIQGLLATPDAGLLNACALLELLIHQDEFTATVHQSISAILTKAAYEPPPWPTPTPSDRDRALAEITTLLGRSPQHAQALSTLIQSILTSTTA
ncbi:tetratricopeptide repeat protein [Streptomyces prunicolor]|uniref:Tetratricopeptide repeat protein n=1 Tax=Streptomyces prunicolor TaxID=67348 RepID=A0ABU4FMD1_9ACTN|nr:tetratricopeptide repeat protein [Streptomyces prunicolor]MDV7221778.1 tetratricopeptide repeat protein [Streptomyces prunicolor]